MISERQDIQATTIGDYNSIGAAGCNSIDKTRAVPIGAQRASIITFSCPSLEEDKADIWRRWENRIATDSQLYSLAVHVLHLQSTSLRDQRVVQHVLH